MDAFLSFPFVDGALRCWWCSLIGKRGRIAQFTLFSARHESIMVTSSVLGHVNLRVFLFQSSYGSVRSQWVRWAVAINIPLTFVHLLSVYFDTISFCKLNANDKWNDHVLNQTQSEFNCSTERERFLFSKPISHRTHAHIWWF